MQVSVPHLPNTLSACSDILANWEFDRRWIRPRPRPDDSAGANSDGICRERCFRSHRHDRRTHRLSGGQLLTLDESVLRRQAQEAANRLDQANAGTYASAATVARLVGAFCAAQGCTGHTLPRKLGLTCDG